MVNGRKLSGYLVILAVFVLGAASGGAASFAYGQQKQAALLEADATPMLETRRMRGLARRLDLDETQQERVRAILADAREELRKREREMVETCGQPLQEQREKVDAAIRAELRPEQQERFDRLLEERGKRGGRKRGPRGRQRGPHDEAPSPP